MSPSSSAAARAAPTAAHPAAHPGAPARRPVGPRRVSGPARPAERVQRPTIARPAAPAPFTQHLARVVDHSLLDRLIRGRAWIGLVAFALIGIVTMQVTLLRLNAGIGSSIERATTLQRETSLLAAQVAQLGSPQRVQAEATQLGMVYAPPGDVRYLHAAPGDASRAASSFVAPSTGTTGSAGVNGSLVGSAGVNGPLAASAGVSGPLAGPGATAVTPSTASIPPTSSAPSSAPLDSAGTTTTTSTGP
jgi:cell division protein FtsL